MTRPKGRVVGFRANNSEEKYLLSLKNKFKHKTISETLRWVVHQSLLIPELTAEIRKLSRAINNRLSAEHTNKGSRGYHKHQKGKVNK